MKMYAPKDAVKLVWQYYNGAVAPVPADFNMMVATGEVLNQIFDSQAYQDQMKYRVTATGITAMPIPDPEQTPEEPGEHG